MILLGVGISIALVVLVGFLVSKRVAGDSANFLVGGRMLPLILVGGALMGSAVDTNATLGNTDLASQFGFWAGACLPLGLALCLFLTGLFFAKPMNRMGLTSYPDYYRLRFGRQVEAVASLMLIVGFCLLVAGNLVAGGFLFNYFLGIPYWLGAVIIAILAVAYTGTGGLIADAYTAIIQMYWCSSARSDCSSGWPSPTASRSRRAWARWTSVDDRSGPGRHRQLGDARRARHRRHRHDRLHAADLRGEVARDGAPRLLPRGDRGGGHLRAVRHRGALGEVVHARRARRPDPVRIAESLCAVALTIVVLCGLVGASMSTANGAILAISNVSVRNLGGVRRCT